MAVTILQTRTRPVFDDHDISTSDEIVLKRSTDTECGSKHPARANSRRRKFSRSISSEPSSVNEEDSEKCQKSQPSNSDAEAYLEKRHMTPMQERCNAITMLPIVIYPIYFILAGCWLAAGDQQSDDISESSGWIDIAREAFGNEHDWFENIGCVNSPMFPYLTALPPLPVVTAAFGIIAHSPFSMLYHGVYAATIEKSKRTKHWSRRLDNAFIHFASATSAYATSGRIDYFLLNVAFNIDCAYRQFEEKVRPLRNQVRTGISILLYILPVLVHGHFTLFLQFVLMFSMCGWLFVRYPAAGWSHSLFHLVLGFFPYLVMSAAMQLESSQLQIKLAMKCASIAHQQ